MLYKTTASFLITDSNGNPSDFGLTLNARDKIIGMSNYATDIVVTREVRRSGRMVPVKQFGICGESPQETRACCEKVTNYILSVAEERNMDSAKDIFSQVLSVVSTFIQ